MLFNPLFVQIGVPSNLVDSAKSSKLNNTSYLFSDIIRVVNNDNTSGKASTLGDIPQSSAKSTSGLENLLNLFNIKTLSSQVVENSNTAGGTSVNLQELLKKLLAGGNSNVNDFLSALTNDTSAKDSKSLNLLTSETDLNNFLQKLFDALPALKMVAGGDKNFLVKPVSGNNGKDSTNEKQQVEDAIINLLQTNSNVILNFNLGTQQFKIEITKVDGTNSASAENSASAISGNSTAVQTSQGSVPAAATDTAKTDSGLANQTGIPLPDIKASSAGTDNKKLSAEEIKLVDTASANTGAKTSVVKETADTQLTNPLTQTDAQNVQGSSQQTLSNMQNQAQNGDAKYIMTVKIDPVQVQQTEPKNVSQVNEVVQKNIPGNAPAENNMVQLDFSGLDTSNASEHTGSINVDVHGTAKEFFNPPITLKLSMKQQLKSVDNNNVDASNVILDNKTEQKNNLQSSLNPKSFKNDLQNSIDPNSLKNNSQGAADLNPLKNASQVPSHGIQNQVSASESSAENIKQTSNVAQESAQKDSTVKSVEVAAPEIKSSTPNTKAQEGSSSSAAKDSGQVAKNESGNPVLQTENTGDNTDKKFTGDRQKDPELKTGSSQAVGDFDKFVMSKDKVADGGNQFTSSLKTINVSDIVKEFTSIINQKESKSVVLQLKPENLGKIKLSVDIVDNVVHAHVEVENDSVKQMVQSNIDTLKHSLNLNGLQLSAVDVSLSGGQQKSFKSFNTKKKVQYTGGELQLNDEPESLTSRNMGYNTYEYLI